MRNLLWDKSVFLTLLGAGVIELVLTLLIGKNLITSIYQVIIPIIVGLVIGAIVTLIEILGYQQRCGDKYHPTKTPYIVLGGILLFNILFYTSRLWIAVVFGSYLLALAITFRTYEINTGRSGVTWTEFLSG